MENDYKKVVITKQWLESAACLKNNGSIDIRKLEDLLDGQKYMIDEASFLAPESTVNAVSKRKRKS